jgi:hypothetical protein
MEKLIERLLGKEWIERFEIGGVRELEKGNPEDFENELVVELREKANQIPEDLPLGVKLESKGFCDPIEVIDFPIGGVATYLKFYRRRWRDIQTQKEYRNEYDLRFPGTKLTRRFAAFLKGKDREEIDELCRVYPSLRDSIEEALPVVQGTSVRVRRPWYKRIFGGT